jgi:hypothetical protein
MIAFIATRYPFKDVDSKVICCVLPIYPTNFRR